MISPSELVSNGYISNNKGRCPRPKFKVSFYLYFCCFWINVTQKNFESIERKIQRIISDSCFQLKSRFDVDARAPSIPLLNFPFKLIISIIPHLFMVMGSYSIFQLLKQRSHRTLWASSRNSSTRSAVSGSRTWVAWLRRSPAPPRSFSCGERKPPRRTRSSRNSRTSSRLTLTSRSPAPPSFAISSRCWRSGSRLLRLEPSCCQSKLQNSYNYSVHTKLSMSHM